MNQPFQSEGYSIARQALEAARRIEDPLGQMSVFEAALEQELGEWRLALKSLLGTLAGRNIESKDQNPPLGRQRDFAERLNWVMARTGVSLGVADEPGISFRLTVTPHKSGIGSFQFLGPSGQKRLGSVSIPIKSRLKLQIVRDLRRPRRH